MSDKIEYSRLLIKRATETGVTPTIPTGTTLSTFTNTDLFVGELFLNTTDENLWVRTDNGILQILNSGYTSSIFATGFTYDNANTLTISNNNGSSLSTSINTMTGLTVNGAFSATTLFGDGSGLTNINTGDIYVTGFTYDNANRLTIVSNSGASLNTYINVMTGLTINGAISASTYQNLPIDPDNYVTGGTYNSGTLTLNRQNGSVTVTGFTDTTFSGGSGNCITDLYTSNIIGCSPLSIYSDNSISGYTTGGSYTAKDVNSGGSNLKRTITKSSSGEISTQEQQLDRLKFDVDNNAGNLYTSTQKIDYIEFNTYNDTSKDRGLFKYEDGVGIEISETKVDTGEFYKLSIDKVENVLEHNNNAGRSSRLEQNFTTQQLITVSGSSQSSVSTQSSPAVNLDTTDGTNDGSINMTPSSVVTEVTDGGTNISNIQTYTTNTIIVADTGTQNSYLDTQYNSIQAVTTDTASGNFGNLTVSPTQLQLTSLEGTFNNQSLIDVTPLQTTASVYDDSLAANVTSITLLNSSTDGSAVITAIGNTSNLFQDTLSLDPLNGSYLKSQSTIGADYSELTLSPSNLKTESTYGSNQVITTYDATNTLLVSTTSTGSISSSLILDPTENYDTTGIQTTDGTNTNLLLVRPNDIYLESSDGVDSRNIQITPTAITVTNGVVEYAADYSSQYTNRSIVDKEYVDSVAGGGSTFTGGTVTGNTIFTAPLSAKTLTLDTTFTGTTGVGTISWNTDFGVPQVGMIGGNVVGKIGESVYAYVKNVDSTTLNKGEVVYIFGASGDKISVKRASSSGDTTSSKTLGVVAESISVNGLGYVITQGTLDGLNLGTYTAGDILWLSQTPGQFTNVKAYAPNHLVFIGVVQRANSGNGQMYVKPQNGYELDELHNVAVTGATNGDLLIYNSGTTLWENSKTLTGTYTVNGGLNVTGTTTSNTISATTYNGDGKNLLGVGGGRGSFGITIDGGGSAITTGVKGYITIPYNGTITGWDIFGDTSGSIVVDVWKDTYANFPPTVADTIAGSEKPTLSSAVKNQDLTLSTWTTSVTAGDIVAFNVDSASTVTRVNLIIYITKQ